MPTVNRTTILQVRSFDKDAVKMLDKKLLLTQTADYIQQKLHMSRQQ